MHASDRIVRFGPHEAGVHDWGGPDDRAPIVLLPGGGRNVADWEPAVPLFREHHRVVGVDLPGHGASSEPADGWDWDVAVEFVEQVVDALDLATPFVVGHSLGGMVAAHYGLRHPDAPGVVNVDGHGLGGPSVPKEFGEHRAELLRTMPPPSPDAGDDEWLRAEIDAMRPLIEGLGLDWERAQPALRAGYAPIGPGRWQRRPSNAFVATWPDVGPDLFDVYRAVKCPLLIFNCTKLTEGLPRELMVAYRDSLAADLDVLCRERPGIRVETVDAGHYVMVELPAWTAERLLAFTGTSS